MQTARAGSFSLGTILKMIGRALTLHCPRCGSGQLLRSWTKMRTECPTCGLHLEREEKDFWLGGYLINFFIAEMLVALALAVVVLSTWPDVPWTALEFGAAVMVIAAPFVFYPFSRLIWLAIDLVLRPTV
jgi:uncharacterized protein (DUF983 family)